MSATILSSSEIAAESSVHRPARAVRVSWASLAILLLALALRLAWLDAKPVHFDEGVNGWFVDQMTADGFYHYDPTNFHGPLHFYVLFVAQTLLGRHAWALRLPIALLSTGCVALVLKFRPHLGRRPAQFAALAMAISPGMVFYGRDAIHETWLVFFQLLAFCGLAGLWREGKKQNLWAVVAGATGMMLTKETYVIHFAAILLAVPTLIGLARISPPARESFADQQWRRSDFVTAASIGLGFILFFYTGGLLDWASLPGLWETFSTWIATGTRGETGHEKIWLWKFWKVGFVPFVSSNYWLELLSRYEWPALIGLLATPLVLLPRIRSSTRFLAIYGVGTLAAYSLVDYKTPWCLLSLMWPFHLLFGLVLDRALSSLDKWIAGGVGAAVLVHSLSAACLLNFRNCTDETESYVYVQTLPDIDKLMQPLRALVARDARNFHLPGHVLTTEHHPLPWLLGDFTRVDFGDPDHLPEKLEDSEFLLVDESIAGAVEAKLTSSYFKEPVHLRGSSPDASVLYFRASTFASLFPRRAAEFRPALQFE